MNCRYSSAIAFRLEDRRLVEASPEQLFAQQQHTSQLFWLDSGCENSGWSYLGLNPLGRLEICGNKINVSGAAAGEEFSAHLRMMLDKSPLYVLKTLLNEHRAQQRENPEGPPFCGGWVGFIGYDSAHAISESWRVSDLTVPTLSFNLFDTVLAYSHAEQRWWGAVTKLTNTSGTTPECQAQEKVAHLIKRLFETGTATPAFPSFEKAYLDTHLSPSSSAPTGLCPPAQGCRAAATLGDEKSDFQQPQRGCGAGRDNATTPLGLLESACSLPRVGAARQPWAEGQIPFGESLIPKDVYKDELEKEGGSQKSLCVPSAQTLSAHSNFSRAGYEAAVERALEYIAAGDIYQINIAQRFSVPWDLPPEVLYASLRRESPAAYGAFLGAELVGRNQTLCSISPELFLSLRGNEVITRPIKGTRPLGGTEEQSAVARRDLESSVKEIAELNMIVDLERNDLGLVCDYGSVRVLSSGEIEKLPTLFHRVATVTGRLHSRYSGADLLAAAFPGGSVTGAPKIRAMRIIEELEPSSRGPYCGAIGWIGLDGDLDLSIAIRTALYDGNQRIAHYFAGSGIVADSKPAQEYEETLYKAAAFFRATSSVGVRSPIAIVARKKKGDKNKGPSTIPAIPADQKGNARPGLP